MAIPDTLRIGTRASLLARAQSMLIAQQLQALHPDLRIEIVAAETAGDLDQATPLSRVNDPVFFSDTLDRMLLDAQVDCCVHAWKDLSGPRPAGLAIAAVPERELPHDIVLFRPSVRQRLASGKPLRIGTSSLRREINTRDFLEQALPRIGPAPRLEFTALRGPVDQRVQRISDVPGSGDLDAVVLALAGLARLWNFPEGRQSIEATLRDALFMLLPLSECPTAPAQGALAVEHRADDQRSHNLLAGLHYKQSARLVDIEHGLVAELMPDEPAAAGASALPVADLDYVVWLRGRRAAGTGAVVSRTRSGTQLPPPTAAGPLWQGEGWAGCTHLRHHAIPPLAATAVFVAHSDALPSAQPVHGKRCWTSGVRSWYTLAERGIWVEGCTDNLGFDHLDRLRACELLQLPPADKWTALTHSDAISGWHGSGVAQVIASYTRELDTGALAALQPQLAQATHFYWSSARQYQALHTYLPTGAQHACGRGKTLSALRDLGLSEVQPFASRREWQQWLN